MLSSIRTYDDFAAFLGVEAGAIKFFAYSKTGQRRGYRKFSIRKKGGGTRTLRAPRSGLYKIQRAILDKILTPENLQNRHCVFSYVNSQGPLEMAGRHVSRDFVASFDIEDFFGSITFPRILGALQAFPLRLPYKWSVVIAQLCTCDGILPQGAPTSPALSNLIARRMDGEFIRLAKEHGFRYSRYSDDLVFSGDTRRRLSILVEQDLTTFSYVAAAPVREIIEGNHFRLNASKTRVAFRKNKQMVVGAVCNRRVNVDRKYIRQLRTLFHLAKKSQSDALDAYRLWSGRHKVEDVAAALKGRVEYVRAVKGSADSVFISLAESFNYCFPHYKPVDVASKISRSVSRFDERHVQVCRATHENYGRSEFGDADEATVARYGSCFFLEGVGLITSFHNLLHNISVFSATNPLFDTNISSALACDPKKDIAILDGSSVLKGQYLSLRPEQFRELQSSEEVTVLGFPNYFEGDPVARVSAQIVRPLNRFGMNLFALNQPLMEGMSGGPVLNERGRIVGVVRSNWRESLIVPISYFIALAATSDTSTPITNWQGDFIPFSYQTDIPVEDKPDFWSWIKSMFKK